MAEETGPFEDIPVSAYERDFEFGPDNIVRFGGRHDDGEPERGVNLTDFYAFMPTGQFIFAPSRDFWPATSVNHRIPPQKLIGDDGKQVMETVSKNGKEEKKAKYIPASAWLAKERPVEQMTWAPGENMIIEGRLVSDGGWIRREGCRCFNLYRPPICVRGDPARVRRWVDHIKTVYPTDAEHIIHWLAHRVQKPHEKLNHALVLGGNQGVGKDTLLEPVKYAIGAWNFAEASPQQMLGRFNGFLKSVILRVSEARDLGEVDRFAFYDHMKTYTAAPPDVLRVDEKHIREHAIFNVVGIIITSNHKTDGLHLPPDDRRHYVAWSELTRDDFSAEYWSDLWQWYEQGGRENVAEYLRTLDLSGFNAKAPPPRTPAFYDIVNSNRSPEDAELADAMDGIGWPTAVTLSMVSGSTTCSSQFADYLRDRKNSRRVPHRMESVGYIAVHNNGAKDGLYKVLGKRQVIYAKADLSMHERHVAAEGLGRSAFDDQ